MGGTNLSKASKANNWAEAINSLPSLLELLLTFCHVGHIPLHVNNLSTSLTLINFVNIRFIDDSFPIPQWLFQLKSLVSLDPSDNFFSGQIPAFNNATKIQFLDLSWNDLDSTIPDWVYSCKHLRSLDLSYDSIQGQISEAIGNLSSLEYLELHHNKLIGNLPVSLGQLSKMIEFNVRNNQLEGIVNDAHFANLSNLDTFSASGNHLTMSVGPNWILPKNIRRLGLGSWSLGAGPHPPSWLHTRRNMDYLDISDAGISGTIPSWFFDIGLLNVSFNNFHGEIPQYINSGTTYLSHNNFSGSLPRIGDQVQELDLSHNTFYDGLSNLFCDSTYQRYALSIIYLEGHLLSGELPDCWDTEKWSNLQYLNVGNNTMSGRLPNSFGSLRSLRSLNLKGNKFTGQIPFSMRNCTSLLKMDLGYNNLDGNIPTWIGTSLEKLKILILPSNKFIGEISWELCHLQSLQILDLSSNKISGIIPKCLHNLTAMATKRLLLRADSVMFREDGLAIEWQFTERATVATKGLELEYTTILSLVTNIDLSNNNLSGEIPKDLTRLVMLGSLNLSRNQLSSSIPESIGEMKQLESVDFSRNSLSGQIPNGFTRISSLSFLNLSFNNLSGRIPQSTQLQTMDASMYMGNNLCGPPLARNCTSDEGEEAHRHNGEETEEGKKKAEVEWIYALLSLGYAVGFSGVCSVLVLKKSWRDAYFGFVKKMWDQLYVYFHLWIQRF